MAFKDDLACNSMDCDSHLIHLQKLFDRLCENKLKLKGPKCHFAKREANNYFLDHIISGDGITPQVGKVETINKMPSP